MSLCIVIPCYNEADRLDLGRYRHFISQQPEVQLLLVDDGSKDNTLSVLQQLAQAFPASVSVLGLQKNGGKAAAVAAGMAQALKEKHLQKMAYLDADLSTSLEECSALANKIDDKTAFVFGSRILKTDNRIERKWYRFLIGRVVATAISKMLRLHVYDTQCGCKIIRRDVVTTAFTDAFSSRWLFDVEIFCRLINRYGREKVIAFSQEVPLNEWIDTEDSRVKFSYAFGLWIDLWTIYRRYRP